MWQIHFLNLQMKFVIFFWIWRRFILLSLCTNLTCLVPHMLSCHMCPMLYVLSDLTCHMLFVLSCLMCFMLYTLMSHVLSCLTCHLSLVPCVLHAKITFPAFVFPCFTWIFLIYLQLVSFFVKFTTIKIKIICR